MNVLSATFGIHNLSIDELIREAEDTNNTLALRLLELKEKEVEEQLENKIEKYTDIVIDMLSDKAQKIYDCIIEDFEKGKPEYEMYSEALFPECIDTDQLKTYCLENFENGITEEAYKKLLSFTRSDWVDLEYEIGTDDEAIKDEKINSFYLTRCNECLHCFSFGEIERELWDECKIDFPDGIKPSDLRFDGVLTDDGESMIIDLTEEGIGYSINADWLENYLIGENEDEI